MTSGDGLSPWSAALGLQRPDFAAMTGAGAVVEHVRKPPHDLRFTPGRPMVRSRPPRLVSLGMERRISPDAGARWRVDRQHGLRNAGLRGVKQLPAVHDGEALAVSLTKRAAAVTFLVDAEPVAGGCDSLPPQLRADAVGLERDAE